MKDRTSKHPGRVKLKPVAGQTDTYDMTRADDPDDTGTPFNTRTMLQDSTGRFLRLPYANPLVDDAFRHMVDRIVPIGTIRTSPAQSLGDAWLKCDGSQVTFPEYPQLCQMLRSTAGGVSWELTQVGTDPNFKGMSRPVLFKGKWYLAGTYVKDVTGQWGNLKRYTINIASADSIIGPYTIIHTKFFDAGEQIGTVYNSVQMAASAETIAAVWTGFSGTLPDPVDATYVTWSNDGETWVTRTVELGLTGNTGANTGARLVLKDFQTDGTYWAMAYDDSNITPQTVYYITDIKNASTWLHSKLYFENTTHRLCGYLSYANGVWLIAHKYGGKLSVYAAMNPAASWTEHAIGTFGNAVECSQIAFYNNKYWAYFGGSGGIRRIASSADLSEWTISDAIDLSATELISNNRQMACSSSAGVFTTSDPDAGWNQVTLPEGAPTGNLSTYEDILVTTGENALAYHDYATETRTLPTISLSSDTTTFIKAKNELDVFESQQSGG